MRIAAIAVFLTLAGTAQAGYTILEPNNYALGTNVSSVVPGISLSSVTLKWDQDEQRNVVATSEPVYAVESGLPTIGNVLGSDPRNSFWERTDQLPYENPSLRVDFALSGGVSSVLFRWSDWECYSVEYCFDMPIMQIFDTHDSLIATCNFHESQPVVAGCTHIPLGYIDDTNTDRSFYTGYTNSIGNIGYVMIGNFQFVDEMRVQVPEPATLGLLGLGVLALGIRRRRLMRS
jgi:hypothetical protein